MKLRRTALSRKIQEAVFGRHTDYASNLCNHFWLTVFAISCVTIFLPITLLIVGFTALNDWRHDRRHRLENQWMEEGKQLTVRQAFVVVQKMGLVYGRYPNYEVDTYKLRYIYPRDKTKNHAMIFGWCSVNKDYADQFYLYCESIKKKYKPISARAVAARARTTTISYVPTLYCSVTVGITLLVTFLISGYAYVDMLGDPDTSAIGMVVSMIGIMLMVPLFFGLIFGMIYFGGEGRGPIAGFVDKYGETLEDDIFISYLKAAKQKVCPLIEWVDE